MDDRPSQNPNFAGSATAGAASERDFDAGALQTIQQVLGCSNLDRLARTLADRLERLIALPGPGCRAARRGNRLGRPAGSRFRRVDRRVHQSRWTAGVEVRSFRLATDERRYVELLSQAGVVEMNVRVALELQKRNEGRRLGTLACARSSTRCSSSLRWEQRASNGAMSDAARAISRCLPACSATSESEFAGTEIGQVLNPRATFSCMYFEPPLRVRREAALR